MPINYTRDYRSPPGVMTLLQRVKRVRPYDPRLDGVAANLPQFKYRGGIFGQPVIPRSHTGIFEERWALPDYVASAEVAGGPLFYGSLRPDPSMSDPVERNIYTPDLGDPANAERASLAGILVPLGVGILIGALLAG